MGLANFFQENDGKMSITRLMTFMSVAAVLFVFVAQNISAISRGTGPIDFTTNSLAVVFMALGAKVTAGALKDKFAKDVTGSLPNENAPAEDKTAETK